MGHPSRSWTSVGIIGVASVLLGLTCISRPGFAQVDADDESSDLDFTPAAMFKNTERKSGGSVFFRGGWAHFTGDRGGEVFTDTLGTSRLNDGRNGFSLGAGLDLDLGHDFLGGHLMGEILLEYSELSQKRVTQTTSALLGGTARSPVTVAQFSAVVAPKVRWDLGTVRPWLIPVGPAFLVNSPPSNDSTYLDIGLHFGAGVDVVVFEPFVLGLDLRYTTGFGQSGTDTDYLAAGVYLAIDF